MVDAAPRNVVKIIARWPHRGDLYIAIERDTVYYRADQFEHLAGLPAWSTGDTLIDEQWPLIIDGHEYYRDSVAIARAEAADTDTAAAFLAWLQTEIPELLADDTIALAAGLRGFLDAHTVTAAARILDRDPAISIGRDTLFAHMQIEGWVVRDEDNRWAPTALARKQGWLTIRRVAIAPGHTYPQVYVTPSGLLELRRTLHALHDSSAPPPPSSHPPLFED